MGQLLHELSLRKDYPMVDKVVSVFTTALIITGVGIALRPGAPTAKVIDSMLKGFAGIQRAAYGK